MGVLSRALLWALLPAAALCAEDATTQEQTVETEEVPVTDDLQCKRQLTNKVPHLEQALGYVGLPAGEFTFFAPTQEAALRLSKLLAAEGCAKLPVETVSEIVSAGIVPGYNNATSFQGGRALTVPLPSGDVMLRVTKKAKQLLVEIVDPSNSEEVVDVLTATDLNTRACGGRAVVHLVDDIIVPPALIAAVQAASEDPAACPVGGGGDGDVETEDALLSGVDVSLTTPNTQANSTVTAQLDTTAVDSNGNAVPIQETLILGVDTSLEEIAAEGGNTISLSVPVDVMVVVDPGAECDIDIATVNVPVFVSVAVSLLVNGKPLGSGQSDLDYAVCRGEPRPRWRMCGGSRIKKDGTVREVRRGCQAGLQCVRRDDTFATCMPPESRLVYMRTQNWDGTILKCR